MSKLAATPFDRTNFLAMGEVRKLLGGWEEKRVRRAVERGALPRPKILKRNWLFPREATERAVAALLATNGERAVSPGDRDTAALDMLAEGHTDAEVMRALRMPIERVEHLRRKLEGAPSSGAMPAAEPAPAAWVDDFIARSRARRRKGRA